METNEFKTGKFEFDETDPVRVVGTSTKLKIIKRELIEDEPHYWVIGRKCAIPEKVLVRVTNQYY